MLQDTNVIDFVSITKDQKYVRLTITDAFRWDGGDGVDEYEHLSMLQKKINNYFAFIEGGQLYKDYPKAEGKNIIINVMAKYSIPANCQKFYQQVKALANESGYEFEYEVSPL